MVDKNYTGGMGLIGGGEDGPGRSVVYDIVGIGRPKEKVWRFVTTAG